MQNPVYYKKDPNLADLKDNSDTAVADLATVKADVATTKGSAGTIATNSGTIKDDVAIIKGLMGNIETPVNTTANAVPVVSNTENQTILGNHYRVGGVFATLAAATAYDVAIQIAAGYCAKLSWEFEGNTELSYTLYEAPTSFEAGGALTPVNKNRASANTSQVTITAGVTTTLGSPTTLSYKRLSSGKISGGEVQTGEDWILKPSTLYIMRFKNEANPGALTGYWRISWCEKATS